MEFHIFPPFLCCAYNIGEISVAFQENMNGLHPKAQTVLMGIFKITVISR